jgi:GNAT superfamily N-acetyltransferase
VKPEFRGKGIGRSLLIALAARAAKEDCGRLEWSVLDWNVDAIAFYETLGARPVEGWTVYRVSGDALKALGDQY